MKINKLVYFLKNNLKSYCNPVSFEKKEKYCGFVDLNESGTGPNMSMIDLDFISVVVTFSNEKFLIFSMVNNSKVSLEQTHLIRLQHAIS